MISYGQILEDHRKNCPQKDCHYIPKRYRTLEDQQFDNVIHKIPFFSEPQRITCFHEAHVEERYLQNYYKIDRLTGDIVIRKEEERQKKFSKPYIQDKKEVKEEITEEVKKPQPQKRVYKSRNSENTANSKKTKPLKETRPPLTILTENINTEASHFVELSPQLPSKRQRLEEDLVLDNMTYQENYTMFETLSNGLGRCNNGDVWDSSVATLVNMGNTCYLNSVLYSLRFVPGFMHNLHHLVVDLNFVAAKFKEAKTKTSSLGRNGSNVNGSNWRSASSKDLLSIGNDTMPKSKKQIVTEKLHSLYVTMHDLEMKDSSDPFHPKAILQAIKEANQIFEGNDQQDAHELLGILLSCVRVTIDELKEQIKRNQITELIKEPQEPQAVNATTNSKLWNWKRSMRKKKDKEKDRDRPSNNVIPTQPVLVEQEQENNPDILTAIPCDRKDGDSENSSTNGESDTSPSNKKLGYNFVTEDMEGMALHRTRCLECEAVSERKEPFLEIQVPVCNREDDLLRIGSDLIFGTLCVSSEKLCDQNKYFCGECNRYNEAVREVLYEKLPNIMILQLKRFTSNIEKVNAFIPTPLEVGCFCMACHRNEDRRSDHRYKLYCVIMHLGPNMASGHYITYSRASCQTYDYAECARDTPKNNAVKDTMGFFKFLKPKVTSSLLETTTQNGIGAKKNDIQICQSVNCCGVRCKPPYPPDVDEWFEFDDNNFRLLSSKQFSDILNKNNSSTNTPYLLFYTKM